LIGDGRAGVALGVTPDERTGYCFGVEGEVDVYRLIEPSPGAFTLCLWTGPTPTIARTPALSLSVGRVTLDDSSPAWTDYPLDLGAPDLQRIATATMLLHSAALVGCADQLLEITCEYVLGRVQFGVPIGSFQAVQHALADVFVANAVSWNAILTATAEGADREVAPLVARYLAVEAALGAAREGAQFHGGMGFTAELNVHYFLKTVLDGGQRFGSHDDVAAALGREFVRRAC
jgi:hypothetical protein